MSPDMSRNRYKPHEGGPDVEPNGYLTYDYYDPPSYTPDWAWFWEKWNATSKEPRS
jgi:hypothetical protein